MSNAATSASARSSSPTSYLNNPVSGSGQSQQQQKRKLKIDPNTSKLQTSSSHNKQSNGNSSSTMQQQQHHHHHHHHSQQQVHHVLAQSDSKLYMMSSIEQKDLVESTLEEAFNKLRPLISTSQSDSVAFNELSNYSNQSKAHYDELCNALLYSILTDASNSARCLRNLFLCNNFSFSNNSSSSSSPLSSEPPPPPTSTSSSSSSSYGVLINNMHTIITENYFKLQDTPRMQLVWLLRELCKAKVNQCEKLVLQMLRNIQSGSLAEKNIWLAESLMEILSESNASALSETGSTSTTSASLWIYSHNELMLQTLYTYLRIIADHGQAAALVHLRQRETEFCIQILREKWNECMQIGRDLIRLLQNLAKISEFEQLWRQMTNSPHLLSAQFAQQGGLAYLMRSPTRRRCLISRLTIDMERKVYFMITSVKAGQQKRYQDWFQRQYLNTPESQSLRVDLMRYICVVVHPTNEQLNSGLTPRWKLCEWLLNSCTNMIDAANLKLALFFDWLFYDAKKENIMLIEPGILLMFNSTRSSSNPAIAASSTAANNLTSMLFDFLCRISLNYYWPLKDQIQVGIMQAFKDSVEKRVIPSMQVFSSILPDSSTTGKQTTGQERDLKMLIQNTFGNFFQTLSITQPFSAIQTSVTSTGTPLTLPTRPNVLPQRKPASEQIDESTNSSSFQAYFPSIKLEQVEPTLSVIKQEPSSQFSEHTSSFSLPVKLETTASTAQFSSDEEQEEQEDERHEEEEHEEQEQEEEKKQNLVTKPAPTNIAYIQLQKQLHQFVTKPLKLFTCIDETAAANSSNSSSSNLENHLALIQSDDLRDKLNELNEKCKETQVLNSCTHTIMLSSQFKEILNSIHRDPDILSNFSTSLSDIAAAICLILKKDFSNNLLPPQSYLNNESESTAGGANNKFSACNIGGVTQRNNKNFNFINSDLFYVDLQLLGEQVSKRLIFVLFKELVQTANQSNEREILVQLMQEIYLKQTRIGYYFLFFIYFTLLKTNSGRNETTASMLRIYSEFSKERQNEIRNELREKENKKKKNTIDKKIIGIVKDSSSDNNDEDESDDDCDDDNDSSNNEEKENSSNDIDKDESDNDIENKQETSSFIEEKNGASLTESELVLGECYMQDIRLCQQDDPHLFCFLLPFICGSQLLPVYFCNNSELIYLCVSCIDARQLKELIASITSQEIVLLKQEEKNTKTLNKNISNKKRKRTQQQQQTSKNAKSLKNKSQGQRKKRKKSRTIEQFKKNTLFGVLEASLLWETVEQIFFWQLVMAHDQLELSCFLPLLDKLDGQRHAEALFSIGQMLKSNEPTFDLVNFIVKRRIDDRMERSLFIHWTRKATCGETKLAQIFSKLLNKSCAMQQTTVKKIKYIESLTSNTNNSKNKLTAEQQLEIASLKKTGGDGGDDGKDSKRSAIDSEQVANVEQVLFRLNSLRQHNDCINFILKENLLETLQKVYKKNCDEHLKSKYSDLFSLVDGFNDKEKRKNSSDDQDDEQDEQDDNNDEEQDNDNNGQESDSNDLPSLNSKTKKLKSSPRSKTSKNSPVTTVFTRTNSSSNLKTAGNKRTKKLSSAKLNSNNKKQKLRNANSSDSDEKEVNEKINKRDKDDRSNSDDSDSNETESESDSSVEAKNFSKKKLK